MPSRLRLFADAWTWSRTPCANGPLIRMTQRPGPALWSRSLVLRGRRSQPPVHRQPSGVCTIGFWELGVGSDDRESGGTLPVRFPSAVDPGDAGWHIDGSYDVGGQWWVNVHSRHRGLLAFFLFTDVGEDDAPTELIAGSHLDVPRVLVPYGETGVFFGEVAAKLPASTYQRPRVRATGRAGDVFVCPHRGGRPRIIAQPEIAHHPPFALRDEPGLCAVERAILLGLE
jgi:hypothetical protein